MDRGGFDTALASSLVAILRWNVGRTDDIGRGRSVQ